MAKKQYDWVYEVKYEKGNFGRECALPKDPLPHMDKDFVERISAVELRAAGSGKRLKDGKQMEYNEI